MRRGEIRYADLESRRGSEASKRRPVVIVSNDGLNAAVRTLGRGVVTAVPQTSNVARVPPFQVVLLAEDTGLPQDSKAQAEQVRALDSSRLGPPVGRLQGAAMTALEDALRLHLTL